MPRCSYTVLMYHRILPEKATGAHVQRGMFVTPVMFALHLGFLRKHFKIKPLHELSREMRDGDAGRHDKPLCAITFDDGWQDFHKYAYPVLKTYKTPATVFLPTDFIGTERWFWTDRLAYLLVQKMKLEVSGGNKPSPRFTRTLCRSIEQLKGSVEDRIEQAISLLKGHRSEEVEEALALCASGWQLNDRPPGRAFLTWEEVRKMVPSGLVFFGSHTASHRILTTLTPQEIGNELTASRQRLIDEGATNLSNITFSYPNGNHNGAIALMVREAGYQMAVTTDRGWNLPHTDPFMLRRFCIHQDMTASEAMLACRILGLL